MDELELSHEITDLVWKCIERRLLTPEQAVIAVRCTLEDLSEKIRQPTSNPSLYSLLKPC